MKKSDKITTEEYKKLNSPQSQSQRIHELFLKQCKDEKLPVPKTEHRFHPKRKWQIDFFFNRPEFPSDECGCYDKTAVEIEGGTWIGGRHTSGSGYNKDREKYNEMAFMGITLFRFTPQEVKSGFAVKYLKKYFDSFLK